MKNQRLKSGLVGAAVFLLSAGCTSNSHSDGDGELDESTPPPQEQTAEGAIDVCHHWDWDQYLSYTDYSSTPDAPTPEDIQDIDLQWIERTFVSVSCQNSLPLYQITFHDWMREAIEEDSDDRNADQELAVYYDKVLTTEGLLAQWNNAVRRDGDRTDYSQTMEDFGDKTKESWNSENRDFQEALGNSLGFLSDPALQSDLESPLAESWMEYGDEVIQTRTYNWASRWDEDEYGPWEVRVEGPFAYGWHILAPLLRFGDYHEDFLAPVATAIFEFDAEVDGDWTIDPGEFSNDGDSEGREPISFDAFNDDPTDAIEPVLEALSRNQEAAQQVYDATGDPRIEELLN